MSLQMSLQMSMEPEAQMALRHIPSSGARLIFLGAIALHATWAVLLSLPEGGIRATPLGWVSGGPGFGAAAAFLWFVVITAALAQRRGASPAWRLLLLTPQQGALLLSAASSATAVLQGHYADGVPRWWAFILADQLPMIALAVMHTVALTLTFGPRIFWRPGWM